MANKHLNATQPTVEENTVYANIYTFLSIEWFRTELRLKFNLVMTPIFQLLFPVPSDSLFVTSTGQFASLLIHHSEPHLTFDVHQQH